MFRIAAIIGSVAALLAWAFAPSQEAGRDATNDRPPAARVRAAAAGAGVDPWTADRRRAGQPRAESVSELAAGPDTTGLLQESWTVEELLDEVNADQGSGFTPVDRDHFAEIVMSEPELRRVVAE